MTDPNHYERPDMIDTTDVNPSPSTRTSTSSSEVDTLVPDGVPADNTIVPTTTDNGTIKPDPQQTYDFLKALYPTLPDGWVSWTFITETDRLDNRHERLTWTNHDGTRGEKEDALVWLTQRLINGCDGIAPRTWTQRGTVIDEATRYGLRTPVSGVFIRMPSTGRTRPTGNKRGTEDETTYLVGLVLDGDYGIEGHKRDEDALPNPDTPEDVRAIWNAALGAEPTIVWDSGHGINGFWSLKNPISVPTDGEGKDSLLKRWKNLSERFTDRVLREAEDRDLNHDSVPDMTRIMRVPGTINAKNPSKPVLARLISTDGPRYTLEELEEIAPEMIEREDGSLVDPISDLVVRGPRPVYTNNGPGSANNGGERPGDHFNREMWANDCAGFWAMIQDSGFGHLGEEDGKAYFERPGKEGSGQNGASLGANDGIGCRNPGAKLFPFSSNAPGLLGVTKTRGGLYRQFVDPFLFLAATQFDKEINEKTGEFRRRTVSEAMSACGKALSAKGYGTRRMTTPTDDEPGEESYMEAAQKLNDGAEQTPDNVPELHVGMWGHYFYTRSGWGDIYGVLKDMKAHCLSHVGVPTLRRWREDWFKWNGRHFVNVSKEDQQNWFWRRMDGAFTWIFVPEEEGLTPEQRRKAIKDGRGEWVTMPWNPKPNHVRELETAGKQVFNLSDNVEANTWLTANSAETPDDRFLACANGLLNLRTRQLKKNDPLFFNTYSVPYEYDPDAKCPLWQERLCEVFEHDPAGLLTFQEMFGYILSGRTDLQKMFLIVGPKRGFKGTTGRILGALIGEENVCGATLGQLNASNNFGMWDLTEKPLAIFGDVRIQGRMDTGVVEKLLSITGEDKMRVDRKNRQPLNVRIPARLVMFSNHIPVFGDASGALQGRFINFRWVKSWYGQEDHGLTGKLIKELPGILNWALDGLERLERNGKFTPNGEQEVLGQMMRETSDPMGLFLEEECDTDEGIEEEGRYWVTKAEFRARWVASRAETGAGDDGGYKDTDANIGRLLAASLPYLKDSRVRIPGGPVDAKGKPKQTTVYLGVRLKNSTAPFTQGVIDGGKPVVDGQVELS